MSQQPDQPEQDIDLESDAPLAPACPLDDETCEACQ